MAKNTYNMNDELSKHFLPGLSNHVQGSFEFQDVKRLLKNISKILYTKMDLLRTNQPGNASSVARSHFSLKINPQYLSYRICQKKSVSKKLVEE